jgi:hypothetical protein
MALYYDGDLDKDLDGIKSEGDVIFELDKIGKDIGYGRAQQILQILWAKSLREKGYPTSGALGHGGA